MISLARGPRTAVLLDRLTLELNLTRPGRGIAFALPLTGITAAANRQIQSATVSVEMQNNREVPAMAESIRYELIVSIIEHGTADEIMAAAKTAGATGGTVLKARGLRAAEVEKFLNITIQPEKDLVLILARADQRQGIMKGHQRRDPEPHGRARHRFQHAGHRRGGPEPGSLAPDSGD